MCTICPGGEIAPPQSGVDTFINIGKGDPVISCEEAKNVVAQTEKGTEVCNKMQRVSIHGVDARFLRTPVDLQKWKVHDGDWHHDNNAIVW